MYNYKSLNENFKNGHFSNDNATSQLYVCSCLDKAPEGVVTLCLQPSEGLGGGSTIANSLDLLMVNKTYKSIYGIQGLINKTFNGESNGVTLTDTSYSGGVTESYNMDKGGTIPRTVVNLLFYTPNRAGIPYKDNSVEILTKITHEDFQKPEEISLNNVIISDGDGVELKSVVCSPRRLQATIKATTPPFTTQAPTKTALPVTTGVTTKPSKNKTGMYIGIIVGVVFAIMLALFFLRR